jgi:hypothetical protein
VSGNSVYSLGAGFSKAVHDSMPLLGELGPEVVRRLDQADLPTRVRSNPADFELWLSYLAGEQPWLDEAQRLRNRAAFVAASRVLASVIGEREAIARSQPMPPWLRSLVARWHEDKATIITFNYDTLVEAAYTETVCVKTRPESDDNYDTAAQSVRAAVTPIGSRSGAVFGPSPIQSFTLLKLHGSRSWLYSGRSSFYGESIYDSGRIRRWEPDVVDPHPWLSEDKVPLIVPPTSGKSGFFDNETIQSQWQKAREHLAAAAAVYFVGYSFPMSDLLVRFLIQDTVTASTRLLVVNPDESVTDNVISVVGKPDTGAPDWLDSVESLAAGLPPANLQPVELLL